MLRMDGKAQKLSFHPSPFIPYPLLRLLMILMLSATAAELFKLEPLRRCLFILCRDVIAAFALCALQYDIIARHKSPSSNFNKLRTRHGPTTAYSTISEMVPAPTVRPPSLIANRNPFSIAIGVINSISIATLSPGITISTPSGRCATPVTSVVRK